jgi:hypothetical protein
VWLYGFQFGAETVSDTLAIGDTVSGEAIDAVADMDRFWFHGEQGQRVNLALQGVAGSVTGVFRALLFGFHPMIGVISPTQADSLGASQTGRIDLPYTGWYFIEVTGWTVPAVGDVGPYRLALTELPAALEHTAGTLAPGDSIVGEVIDIPGDVDEYTLVAPAGQMIALVAQRSIAGFLQVLAYDSLSRDTLAWIVLQDFAKVRRFTMPSSGRAHIAAYEFNIPQLQFCSDPTCNGRYSLTGGFRLAVAAVNPAPESAAPTFAIGDSVVEALSPGTDLDLFTGNGTAGTNVTATFQLDQVPVPAGSMVWFDIYDLGTGAALSNRFGMFGTTPFDISSFRVPASGTFGVRVYGRDLDDTVASAPYRFLFRLAP